MIYLIKFEADVIGLNAVTRVNGEMYVHGKDSSTARHYAESYIKDCYSEEYAILECVPVFVLNME